MATAENAKLEYEAGQTSVGQTELTTSDNLTFSSSASLFSNRSGFAPVVRPNGMLTGGAVTSGTASDDVDVAASTVNLNGAVVSVSGDTLTVIRPLSDVAQVFSVIVDNTGAYDIVEGTESGSATFSETRGAAGGPPFIPVDAVEVAQVRVNDSASASIADSEIFSVVGLHTERADFPLFNVNYESGSITFLAEVDAIHTGSVPKKVYASYATPIFGEVTLASDFQPPETTNNVTSTQIYGTTLGSTSSTLGQGSFTAFLNDGVTDALVTLKNENLWFRFFPNKFQSANILSQGKLGISRTFPAGDNIQAACTISASEAAIEVA